MRKITDISNITCKRGHVNCYEVIRGKNLCRECIRENSRKSAAKIRQVNAANNPEYYIKLHNKYREQRLINGRQSYYRHKDEPKRKIQAKESRERYRLKPENIIKDKARTSLIKAVVRGKIQRPNYCSSCLNEGIPEGHHNDYSKPYEVIWLCKRCHENLHHPPKAIDTIKRNFTGQTDNEREDSRI